jgi:5'-nucleotidase
MSSDIDVVVSGHSHTAYNCTIGSKLLTSAASLGRVITDIDLQIDRKTGRLVSKHAHNVIVSRDVEPSAPIAALIAHIVRSRRRSAGRVVGAISRTLPRSFNDAGESALGDVLADGMLEAAMNTPGARRRGVHEPGRIRGDLAATTGTSSSAVTYAQLVDVLPFGNIVMVKTMTGEALIRVLEEQFEVNRVLQVSRDSPTRTPIPSAGQRVDRRRFESTACPRAHAKISGGVDRLSVEWRRRIRHAEDGDRSGHR